jgi:hypothetical protein
MGLLRTIARTINNLVHRICEDVPSRDDIIARGKMLNAPSEEILYSMVLNTETAVDGPVRTIYYS